MTTLQKKFVWLRPLRNLSHHPGISPDECFQCVLCSRKYKNKGIYNSLTWGINIISNVSINFNTTPCSPGKHTTWRAHPCIERRHHPAKPKLNAKSKLSQTSNQIIELLTLLDTMCQQCGRWAWW
jgi:hypothetical protein